MHLVIAVCLHACLPLQVTNPTLVLERLSLRFLQSDVARLELLRERFRLPAQK